MGRVLGLDYGKRRVGLALSDSRRTVVTPLRTVDRKREDLWKVLAEILEMYSIQEVVIGLPLSMQGEETRRSQEVRAFARAFQDRFPHIAVTLWDERLTSFEAEALLRDRGISPSRNKEKVDQLAATLLLQSYLDQDRFPED
jgi:putative Holliday junction resolvase